MGYAGGERSVSVASCPVGDGFSRPGVGLVLSCVRSCRRRMDGWMDGWVAGCWVLVLGVVDMVVGVDVVVWRLFSLRPGHPSRACFGRGGGGA